MESTIYKVHKVTNTFSTGSKAITIAQMEEPVRAYLDKSEDYISRSS